MNPVLSLFVIFVMVFQAILMVVDEFWFHRQRGLPRWERWGHPLDTASVWVCVLWADVMPFNETTALVFGCLAFFSCVLVTKDESVHQRHCEPWELHVHALLFVLHPLSLAGIFVLWYAEKLTLIRVQLIIVFAFFLWQIVYWNLGPGRKLPVKQK